MDTMLILGDGGLGRAVEAAAHDRTTTGAPATPPSSTSSAARRPGRTIRRD